MHNPYRSPTINFTHSSTFVFCYQLCMYEVYELVRLDKQSPLNNFLCVLNFMDLPKRKVNEGKA